MLRLIIHRGTHSIGGNCVELATDTTRIVIDIGIPLVHASGESFEPQTLEGKSVEVLLNEGILPKVPGLFDSGPSPDAILLSHAHRDHTGLLPYTNPEIPVYLSQGTSNMMYVGQKFAAQPRVNRQRQQIIEPGKPFEIGQGDQRFWITAHLVDHSAYASVAFLVESQGKRVLYSGDLRLHGRKPGMAERLIQAVSHDPVDVLIMEGTNVVSTGEAQKTEWDLEKEIIEHVRQSRGIVLANFSPLHVDRLVTFYRASCATGRTFVTDPYAALVMHMASKSCRIPDPAKNRSIKVYFNRFFEESFASKKLTYVHDMLQKNRVSLESLRTTPEQFVMVFRPSMTDVDFDGRLPHAARFIYSYWIGYLQQPRWADFRKALVSCEGDFVTAHTSGHIGAEDMVAFVGCIRPRCVIPIHTLVPQEFQNAVEGVVVLEDGQPFDLC